MITHNINKLLLMGQPRKIKRTKEHFIFRKAEKEPKADGPHGKSVDFKPVTIIITLIASCLQTLS